MERGHSSDRETPLGAELAKSFAQPLGQGLPPVFLALLAELDRSKRE